MTVRELRALLAMYPDDLLVVVNGYESGYDDPVTPLQLADVKQREGSWETAYAGMYEACDSFDKEEGVAIVQVLVIPRAL